MANQAVKSKETQTDKLSLIQRLAKIRQMANVIQTNKQGYGYKYVSEDEILSKISAGMKKYQVSLFPHVSPNTTDVSLQEFRKTKVAKNGAPYEEVSTEVIVKSDGYFTWLCDDNPEDRYDVPWVFIGQQTDASQAFGSGLTYCNRYFLLKFFNVATVNDDPDVWRSKQKEALSMENKEIALNISELITAEIDKYKELISDSPDEVESFRKDLANFFKERITVNGKKSTNYLAVEDPNVLGDTLTDLKKFIKNRKVKNKEDK